MKIGDLVLCHPSGVTIGHGIIVGFGKKGEGGKNYVDVLLHSGKIVLLMEFEVEVINEKKKRNKRN